MRVVVAGSLVDVSTTISPWRAPLAMPSAPRIDLLDLRRAGHAQDDDVGVARELGMARRLACPGGQEVFAQARDCDAREARAG